MSKNYMPISAANRHLSRRRFLKITGELGLSLAGLSLLASCQGTSAIPDTKQEVLETTSIRLVQVPSICTAPQYMAEEFLRAEGFTDIQYTKMTTTHITSALTNGEVDISSHFAGQLILGLDTSEAMVILAGIHVGCFELFANENVRTIADLKGKTLAISEIGGTDHAYLSSMAAYVGLDPNTDITWITRPTPEAIQLFSEGKVDGFLAFPPRAQELRVKKIGRVVVNSMMDKPWSQYFCCMVVANRDFAKKNPVATRRALRAFLKSTDYCAREPERVVQFMIDKGYTDNYEYALEALQQMAYYRWREYDPEDTLRFYALRLHEAGMIKGNPEEIIARSTDWRFFNEIKADSKDLLYGDFVKRDEQGGLYPYFCRL